MRILCVDVGTGTQDIYLYDSMVDMENGIKMVIPAPTMIVHRQLKEATSRGQPVLLSGVTMGGGPSHWAAESHIEAGLELYATPDAARSFNDDLQVIADMGIVIISDDEAEKLPSNVVRIKTRDFDFYAVEHALGVFGVSLDNLAAVAVAVFDHGAAPPDYSDRKFRFDYIRERIKASDRLSTFAFLAENIPPIMTRMRSVARSASSIDAPLVVMDTAPAAVMGALLDNTVAAKEETIIANIGNFHTLAFRLASQRIEGVFEHHTGLLDTGKLDGLLYALALGSIRDEDVYEDSGHGAFVVPSAEEKRDKTDIGLVATGPRRSLLRKSIHRPYLATPFGDMMLAGCFGLLASTGELIPELGRRIHVSLQCGTGNPPWEIE